MDAIDAGHMGEVGISGEGICAIGSRWSYDGQSLQDAVGYSWS